MSVIPNDKGELPVSQEPEALPLCVIPWSGSAAFVWCSQLENATIAGVQAAGVAFLDAHDDRTGTEAADSR